MLDLLTPDLWQYALLFGFFKLASGSMPGESLDATANRNRSEQIGNLQNSLFKDLLRPVALQERPAMEALLGSQAYGQAQANQVIPEAVLQGLSDRLATAQIPISQSLAQGQLSDLQRQGMATPEQAANIGRINTAGFQQGIGQLSDAALSAGEKSGFEMAPTLRSNVNTGLPDTYNRIGRALNLSSGRLASGLGSQATQQLLEYPTQAQAALGPLALGQQQIFGNEQQTQQLLAQAAEQNRQTLANSFSQTGQSLIGARPGSFDLAQMQAQLASGNANLDVINRGQNFGLMGDMSKLLGSLALTGALATRAQPIRITNDQQMANAIFSQGSLPRMR